MRWFTTVLLIPISTTAAAEAGRFDASSFQPTEAPKKAVVTTTDAVQDEASNPGTPALGEAESDDILKSRLQAFSRVLEREKRAARKAQLQVSIAIMNMQLARNQQNVKAGSESKKTTANGYLKKVVEITRKVAENKTAKVDLRAYSFYLQGLAYADLKLKVEAADSLKKSLELNPDSDYSAGIIFFLGDELLEQDRFEEALHVYQQYQSHLKGADQLQISYKMGVCYVALKKYQKAEAIFSQLVRAADAGQVGKDSVRELAYLATQKKSGPQLVELAQQLFGDDVDRRLDFLSASFSALDPAKRTDDRSAVFNELMIVAKQPLRRIQLWLDEMRLRKRDYASRAHFAGLKAIADEFQRQPASELKQIMGALEADVMGSTNEVLQSFVETFAKRTKNQEKIPPEELAKTLQAIFEFYDRFLKKPENSVALYQLWLDVCNDAQDGTCLMRLSDKIAIDLQLKELRDQGRIAHLVGLDILAKENPKKYRAEFVRSLEAYVTDIKAPQWDDFAARLADVYLKGKHGEPALHLLEKVNEHQKTEESFYNLQMARFELGQYREVNRATPPAGVVMSPRLKEVIREASLKVAIGSRDVSGGFAEYEDNINRYLQLNDDKEKQAIVLRDYIDRLIQRGDTTHAHARLISLSPAMRRNPALINLARKLSYLHMKVGDFDKAVECLTIKNAPLSSDTNYEMILARLGNGGTVPPTQLSQLSERNRSYILGVLALTQPDLVVKFAEKAKSSISLAERRLIVLAMQVQQNATQIRVSAKMKATLGEALPETLLSEGGAPALSEVMARRIRWTHAKTSSAQAAKALTRWMEQVREVRTQVAKDIKLHPLQVQKRVLDTAEKLELKMAEAIESSPIPPNLKPAQQTEYKAELAKISQEFKEQAEDFKKAFETLASEQSTTKAVRLPAAETRIWPWPEADFRTSLFRLLRTQNKTGAILMLDILKATDKMPEAKYYGFRAGVLTYKTDNGPLDEYVRNELQANHQEGLLRLWK